MTSRRAKRRKEAQELDATLGQVAHELERVNLFVLSCQEHGLTEKQARALVPAIRQQCGDEPMTAQQMQDAILDVFNLTPSWTGLVMEKVALAVGAGLQIFCPERVPPELRPRN